MAHRTTRRKCGGCGRAKGDRPALIALGFTNEQALAMLDTARLCACLPPMPVGCHGEWDALGRNIGFVCRVPDWAG